MQFTLKTAIFVLATIIVATAKAAPTNYTGPSDLNSTHHHHHHHHHNQTSPQPFFNHTHPQSPYGNDTNSTDSSQHYHHHHNNLTNPFTRRSTPVPVFPQNTNGDGYCTKAAISNSAYPSGCALAFWYPWNIKQIEPAETTGTLYAYNNECSLLGMKDGAEGKFKYSPAGLDKTITVFNADPNNLVFQYGNGELLGGELSCGQFQNNENGNGFGWLCAFDCSS